MSFLLNLLGTIVVISGLAWIATSAGAPPNAVFAVAMVGLGAGLAAAFLGTRMR
jgi:hypothetical protein